MTRKHLAAAALALCVTLLAPAANASRYDNQYETHPLKVVGYALHAVGQGMNWLVFRPIHWVVSRNNLDVVFGHKTDVREDGTEFLWEHGDYSPSIARERADRDSGASGAKSGSTSTRPAARK